MTAMTVRAKQRKVCARKSDNLRERKRSAGYKAVRGEFWTSRQRQMHSLHYVISYRASFKPELPEYFIRKYSKPGECVLDPFGGRGTTILQANLMDRCGVHNDVNPISTRIAYAKSVPHA